MDSILIDNKNIQDRIIQLFSSTDAHHWDAVRACFANEVLLDYSSMTGEAAAQLTPQAITDAWSAFLPGFDHTFHALSNFQIEIKGNEAIARHAGRAEHYIASEGDNLWVVVGLYEHHLIRTASGWQIDQMRFDFKYMTGNASLPEIAQNKQQK